MTAFVFFIFKSAAEGEGWFEGDSTLLIHYKKNKKNTDSHHEFNVKYERYKQDISIDRKLCLGEKM
jgi:hypothetical protein